jgi:hypothetical protein
MNLSIGCGIMRRDGWETLDADPYFGATYLATIPPLPAEVKAKTYDEVEWIHGVGSLFPWEAKAALVDILGLLSPGGKLTLEQPNFNNSILKPEWLFGDPTFGNPLIMNRWCYTPEALRDLLRDVGFSRIDVLPAKFHLPARDFRIEAYK